MHYSLTTALTIGDFIDPEATLRAHKPRGTQLGALCLAAAASAEGHVCRLIDLDRIATEALTAHAGRPLAPGDLFALLLESVVRDSAPVVGFSSICSSYPLTIRLARETKRRHPESWIVVGGPQASAVDRATLEAFPWIDIVVRGEGDLTFPQLLSAIESVQRDVLLAQLPGITWRAASGIQRNPDAPLITDLDQLPMPAFELDPSIRERRSAHLEIGRGCPFQCTFCSTSRFFRHRFRLKSPRVIVEQMQELESRYGVTNFTLAHDMYTVQRDRVMEFVDALVSSKRNYLWSCSARTDRVDEALIAAMAKAGCVGIFFGVETGSQNLQRVIRKNLNLDGAWNAVRAATSHGMKTAVSLITGFPEETREDLRETIHFYVQATRFEHAEPQITLLAPLAGTPIAERYQDQLEFDSLYSDMSHQGWREDPDDRETARAYPSVFPNFFSVPSLVPRAYAKELQDFLSGLTLWFRWLPIALLEASEDLLGVFDEWTAWRARSAPSEAASYKEQPDRYYYVSSFAKAMLQFVTESLEASRWSPSPCVRQVLDYEKVLLELDATPASEQHADVSERASAEDRFSRATNVVVHSFEFDVQALLGRLRRGDPPCASPSDSCTVALALRAQGRLQILQLPPPAVELLALCDGSATVSEIVERYSAGGAMTSEPVRRKKAAIAGLTSLYRDGLIVRLPPVSPGVSAERGPSQRDFDKVNPAQN